jgi:hypothetical protein
MRREHLIAAAAKGAALPNYPLAIQRDVLPGREQP